MRVLASLFVFAGLLFGQATTVPDRTVKADKDGNVKMGATVVSPTAGVTTPSVYASGQVVNMAATLLPKFRLAAVKAANGTADAKVLFIGDSTTQGVGSTLSTTYPSYGSYVTRVAAGNLGVSAANGLAIPSLNADDRWTQGTGWLKQTAYGFAKVVYFSDSASGNLTFCPGASEGTFDSFDVYWLGNIGMGTLTATATGGSAVPINTSVAQGTYKTTATAGSAGTGNCVVLTATSGAVYVAAVEPWLSTTKKIRMGNGGSGGQTTTKWADSTANIGSLAAITAYAPDLCVISLGINDATASTATATVTANLQAIINTCKLSGDAALMTMPPSSSTPHSTFEALYVPAYYALAQTNNIPILDVYRRFGGVYATAFMSDALHPNQYGYWDWSSMVSEFLRSVIGR
jgi:lysophospholipase L1-like esterase